MKVIHSEFIVKGFKNGNYYFITENKDSNFNVYQLFCDANKDRQVSDIKSILPSLKNLPDDEIIVSIPREQYNAFLLLYNIDILEMNGFRLTLENEQIIS